MTLLEIALGNVSRRKAKAFLAVASLILAVATVITMIASSRAMHAEIGTKMDEYGANILVVPDTQQLTLSYGGISIAGATVGTPEFPEEAVEAIKTIKNYDSVSIISPKLVGAADVDGQQSLLVGVDFKAELKMKKWWNLTGSPPSGPDQVLLGESASRRFGKGPGDEISVQGRPFTVVEVISATGGPEDDLVFSELGAVQSMLGRQGRVTFLEVSALCNTCPIEEIVSQISGVIPGAKVTALKQSVQAREDVVRRFDAFALGLSAVVLAAVGLSVLVTMLSSVSERTREIGVFRAIGYRRTHVFSIIIGEAALLGVVGGVLGYLVGQGLAGLVSSQFTLSAESPPWSAALLGVSVGVSSLLGILASAYPALRASRIDPAEALRFI